MQQTKRNSPTFDWIANRPKIETEKALVPIGTALRINTDNLM